MTNRVHANFEGSFFRLFRLMSERENFDILAVMLLWVTAMGLFFFVSG